MIQEKNYRLGTLLRRASETFVVYKENWITENLFTNINTPDEYASLIKENKTGSFIY